jgi:hypothetical protein
MAKSRTAIPKAIALLSTWRMTCAPEKLASM